jgi:nucleotide-binding universal stress UspA family protein
MVPKRYFGRFGGLPIMPTRWELPSKSLPPGSSPSSQHHLGSIRVPFQEELLEQADRKLAQIIADALLEDREGPPNHIVVRGNAASVLLGEADHATLLVVGRRGHATFEALLWGSVSERCARHAPCPNVVVT